MDFEFYYTKEQEEFRKEVRGWLEKNVPVGLHEAIDPEAGPYEDFLKGVEFRTKLAEKGWYAATWPKEYGGGGLSSAHKVIIDEELGSFDLPGIVHGDTGNGLFGPAVMVWGTEEQKRSFLPIVTSGKYVTWQCFTEPEAGSDLASMRTTAIRHGDEFILNGNKIFVGQLHDVDYLYTLAITAPDNPRHNNIGAFFVPANLPGITIGHLDLLVGGKRTIFFEDVHLPASQLIGGDTDGWKVTQTSLELEHGGAGSAVDNDRYMEKLLDYSRNTMRNGAPISKDPENQSALVDAYIGYQVNRLFGLRNYWMRSSRTPFTYEGSQYSLNRKIFNPKLAEIMLKVLGPQVLITDHPSAPYAGRLEYHIRNSIRIPHPGGTVEIQKLIMARRLGVSRTREQGAAYI
ncbi:MAG: hypothetical protein EXR50_07850 [Dehalococcoidia bacterium]|nr:hypothetical protein [Dehalococcoidia bacterium]